MTQAERVLSSSMTSQINELAGRTEHVPEVRDALEEVRRTMREPVPSLL